jgi:hypothetical protein
MAADADNGDAGDVSRTYMTWPGPPRLVPQGLVRSSQAPNHGRSTKDHEPDADSACDETLGRVVGMDLAKNTPMHEGSRE